MRKNSFKNIEPITKLILLITIFLLFTSNKVVYAQGKSSLLDDSLVDMYTVTGTGLGGAVLGASTLSFVSVPADHLKNIMVGGAVGVIIGVAIVAYNQANKSKSMYMQTSIGPSYMPTAFKSSISFETSERMVWHSDETNIRFNLNNIEKFPAFNYNLKF